MTATLAPPEIQVHLQLVGPHRGRLTFTDATGQVLFTLDGYGEVAAALQLCGAHIPGGLDAPAVADLVARTVHQVGVAAVRQTAALIREHDRLLRTGAATPAECAWMVPPVSREQYTRCYSLALGLVADARAARPAIERMRWRAESYPG